CSDGSGSSLAVVLTVGRITYTAETVAFYNTLESLTFGSTYDVDFVTFDEYFVHDQFIPEAFFHPKIPEFCYVFFGCGVGSGKMSHQRLGGTFGALLSKTQLNSVITIGICCLYLRHHTWTGLNDRCSHIPTIFVIKACHADFST